MYEGAPMPGYRRGDLQGRGQAGRPPDLSTSAHHREIGRKRASGIDGGRRLDQRTSAFARTTPESELSQNPPNAVIEVPAVLPDSIVAPVQSTLICSRIPRFTAHSSTASNSRSWTLRSAPSA